MQRAGAAKPDSTWTVFDGSSVLSTDGGIPVDYEDGELEDEGTSSSMSHGSKPAAGTRRPREDDSDASSSKRPRSASDAVPSRLEALAITSEQRDATRTDDTVREPWMPSKKAIDDRYGATVPPNEIPLYVDNRLVDDAEAAAKHFEPTTNQRRDYYISLFHELRYWISKKTSGRSRVPELQALCQSWNEFVEYFNKDPAGYRERIASARERFMKYSITSVVQRVHEVDHGLQALHARVEALETVQAAQLAELRQELFLQKAYVAEAAQTTSNIRVEVSEQVRLLQEKVKRLEEMLRTCRASSSASHHD
ncbi:hypothetical protein PHMEG_00016987 [Phytophthora megakarya]|uniref:Uncharacterized protein n=1 Tax=Phytophthora megakarya TaxID=4795 RepID=A0A225VXE2_9STRA|nr:hypothetical protein PHMEG_00016987 [Phytophthora megakarya]